ncbi:uncharacterized protein LY89DRAFT_591637 [Mollisia scopiformis]|uniref:Uncharacterized protein n=1 Tax=Mollisia scopiformis TaxID=149040 RepID=A0A194X0P7_MOLSC|nr:uncharacterized protein LY89DRAFT_591637 [Mollisia scopiformis]KUJ13437.1 hypothetical protein LY89DRAFT_591637 [Mollisia scopiformis]
MSKKNKHLSLSKTPATLQTSSETTPTAWSHKPSNLTIAWLLISIPLVIWDTIYVLFRPLTMPGGSLQYPLYIPYEIYLQTDYIYGWKALEQNNGFTAAQATMNIVETALYCWYLYIVLDRKYVGGKAGTLAVLVGFSAALMTLSKTVLYGLNEAFSGWSNVGHNEWGHLVLYYIIPNGSWLVASALMSMAFGSEILQGLSLAGGEVLLE